MGRMMRETDAGSILATSGEERDGPERGVCPVFTGDSRGLGRGTVRPRPRAWRDGPLLRCISSLSLLCSSLTCVDELATTARDPVALVALPDSENGFVFVTLNPLAIPCSCVRICCCVLDCVEETADEHVAGLGELCSGFRMACNNIPAVRQEINSRR